MISKEKYANDPCGTVSLPYWKCKKLNIPDNMKILHDREFSASEFGGYRDEPYFRLYHSLKVVRQFQQNRFEIIFGEINVNSFVQLINACYTDLKVTVEQIKGYRNTPVFCPELWLLVREKDTGNIVGGGIADLDREIGEGILEWIQVLPEYRGHGIGQLIVNSLLDKMQGEAQFATVSGKVNNPTNPEALYRKCGFAGNDVWHVLIKK